MPFLSPNQQRQSTEGKISHSVDLLTPSSPGGLPTLSLTTNSSQLPSGYYGMIIGSTRVADRFVSAPMTLSDSEWHDAKCRDFPSHLHKYACTVWSRAIKIMGHPHHCICANASRGLSATYSCYTSVSCSSRYLLRFICPNVYLGKQMNEQIDGEKLSSIKPRSYRPIRLNSFGQLSWLESSRIDRDEQTVECRRC